MWFTEDAWSPIIACLVGCGVLFGAYAITQRSKLLIGIPVLLVVAVLAFIVDKVVITDRERVELTLLDLINSFVEESQQADKNKEPQCIRFFSEQNKRDRLRVGAAVVFVRVDDPRVTDVQIQMTNQNTRAITHFRANGNVTVGGGEGHHASRWELTWQKEAGEWKVTTTRMLNVMTGVEQAIPRVD